MGHHVKEEKDELGNFMPRSFVERQNIEMWLHHLPGEYHIGGLSGEACKVRYCPSCWEKVQQKTC